MNTSHSAAEVLRLLELESQLAKRSRIDNFYPDTDQWVDQQFFPRRAAYPKHMAFFAAGATRRERAFIAANKINKSESVGGYELTMHLTGRYKSWWSGRRFNRPIQAWAAGDTAKTTRDIIEGILLGKVGEFGTGLIPPCFNPIQMVSGKSSATSAGG
jgi:hypothetical protein